MISDDDWARKAREVLGKDWARKVPWGRSYRPKPKTDQQLAKQLAGRIGRRLGGRLGRYLILAGIPVIGAIGTAIWEAITPGEVGTGADPAAGRRQRPMGQPGSGVLRRGETLRMGGTGVEAVPAPGPPAAVREATRRARENIPGSAAAERDRYIRATQKLEEVKLPPSIKRLPDPLEVAHPTAAELERRFPRLQKRFPRMGRIAAQTRRGIYRTIGGIRTKTRTIPPGQAKKIISQAQDIIGMARQGRSGSAPDVFVNPVTSATVAPITNIVTQPTGPSIVQTPYGMPTYVPIPMSRSDTGTSSSSSSCQCPPKRRKGPKRECREWGQLSWRSGRKKGKAAGRRCVVYKQ